LAANRFLFFLYYYPPVSGTAAKRNARISSAIAARSESAIIYTATQEATTAGVEGNIRIQHISAFDYRSLLRRKTKDGALPENVKKGVLAQMVIRLINTFPFNIIGGEGGLIYFLNLLSNGRRAIRDNAITHLYSSYRPFADHYAAYFLKKKYPHVYWVADFRDLIIDPHYNHIFFSRRHHSFFKKIFSSADVLTTVSDGLTKHLRAYNPQVITLRNGIEGEIQSPPPVSTSFFTMAYTGSMFLDKRNAEPLFKALQELIQEAKIEGTDLRIIYAGKDSLNWKNLAAQYRFESLLDDRGIVSPDQARQIQDEACINLLLTISSDQLQGVLTGKMIEYFQSGSPVLGIVVDHNDPELQGMLHELEIGTSLSDQEADLEAIKTFLFDEYTHWKSTGMNRKPVNIDILRSKYSMESVMKPLFEKFHLVDI
jgi:glycosyltransferase involved in cell wall biosynthesis